MSKGTHTAPAPPLLISVLVAIGLTAVILYIASFAECPRASGATAVAGTTDHSPGLTGDVGNLAPSAGANSQLSAQKPSARGANKEQVELLFDYTKFHIGLYFTLATLVLSLLGSDLAKRRQLWHWALGVAVISLALAGVAGGVIASSLPHLFDVGDVRCASVGPLMFENCSLVAWTYVEHMFFWAAVAFAIIAFFPAMLGKTVNVPPAEPLQVILLSSQASAPTPTDPPAEGNAETEG